MEADEIKEKLLRFIRIKEKFKEEGKLRKICLT